MADKSLIKQAVLIVPAVLLAMAPVFPMANIDEPESDDAYEEDGYYMETEIITDEINNDSLGCIKNEQAEENSEWIESGNINTEQAANDRGALADTSNVRAAICSLAEKQLGVAYVTGGDKPAGGFDCSGLIKYVFYTQGIKIPGNSRRQFASGNRVQLSDIKPGDVVFFQVYSKGEYGEGAVLNKVTEYIKTNPTHVGIYMGNGIFIHAPAKGKSVKKSDLRKEFWKKHLIGIRDYTTQKEWTAAETDGALPKINAGAIASDAAKLTQTVITEENLQKAKKVTGVIMGKAKRAYNAAKKELLK